MYYQVATSHLPAPPLLRAVLKLYYKVASSQLLPTHQFSASSSPATPRTTVVRQSRQCSSPSSPDTPRPQVVLPTRQFSSSRSPATPRTSHYHVASSPLPAPHLKNRTFCFGHRFQQTRATLSFDTNDLVCLAHARTYDNGEDMPHASTPYKVHALAPRITTHDLMRGDKAVKRAETMLPTHPLHPNTAKESQTPQNEETRQSREQKRCDPPNPPKHSQGEPDTSEEETRQSREQKRCDPPNPPEHSQGEPDTSKEETRQSREQKRCDPPSPPHKKGGANPPTTKEALRLPKPKADTDGNSAAVGVQRRKVIFCVAGNKKPKAVASFTYRCLGRTHPDKPIF